MPSVVHQMQYVEQSLRKAAAWEMGIGNGHQGVSSAFVEVCTLKFYILAMLPQPQQGVPRPSRAGHPLAPDILSYHPVELLHATSECVQCCTPASMPHHFKLNCLVMLP